MINIFKKFFKKQQTLLKDIQIGQFIKLKYKDPKTVGIINHNHLTCTRLNPDEINNREIQGFVISKYFDNDLRIWFVGIRACKKAGNEIIERDFLFLENEIENFQLMY